MRYQPEHGDAEWRICNRNRHDHCFGNTVANRGVLRSPPCPDRFARRIHVWHVRRIHDYWLRIDGDCAVHVIGSAGQPIPLALSLLSFGMAPERSPRLPKLLVTAHGVGRALPSIYRQTPAIVNLSITANG